MPIKIEYKSEQEVRDIPMTGLVSYSDIIDETYRLVKEKGLEVISVSYKPSSNKDTVTASFVIRQSSVSAAPDPELDMGIVWTHSYHKAVRFQCNVCGVSYPGNNLVVRDPTQNVKTRRASDAEKYKAEIFEDLKLETAFITTSFNDIIKFKDNIKDCKANIGAGSVSLGLLYVEEDLLTTSQVSVIKDSLKSNTIENGWDMYKCFADGLKDSHPKLFLTDHIKLYSFFEEIFSEEPIKNETEKLYLPNKNNGKTVNEEIKEQYDYISPLPSVTFL